jgi:hypothetical protein
MHDRDTEILTGFHAEAQRARRDFDRINGINRIEKSQIQGFRNSGI